MRGMGLLLLLQLAWITATYAAPWSHFLDWFRSNSEQWTILFPKMTFLRPSQEALQGEVTLLFINSVGCSN
eukprot:scaffold1091_cov164-Ochromonas_danica.AAC.19